MSHTNKSDVAKIENKLQWKLLKCMLSVDKNFGIENCDEVRIIKINNKKKVILHLAQTPVKLLIQTFAGCRSLSHVLGLLGLLSQGGSAAAEALSI